MTGNFTDLVDRFLFVLALLGVVSAFAAVC
jgi:hypothetical protein